MFTHRRGRVREMAKSLEAGRRQQTEGSLCLRGEGEIEGYWCEEGGERCGETARDGERASGSEKSKGWWGGGGTETTKALERGDSHRGKRWREEKENWGKQREKLKSNENMEYTAQRQLFYLLEKCRKHKGSSLHQMYCFFIQNRVWRDWNNTLRSMSDLSVC